MSIGSCRKTPTTRTDINSARGTEPAARQAKRMGGDAEHAAQAVIRRLNDMEKSLMGKFKLWSRASAGRSGLAALAAGLVVAITGVAFSTEAAAQATSIRDTKQNLGSLGPGTYGVTVTDANACTATASAAVTQPILAPISTRVAPSRR